MSREISHEAATEIADEVQGHFSDLYPRLALPYGVWSTLHEMIEAECRHAGGAADVARNKMYIAAAVASGLRNEEDNHVEAQGRRKALLS